MKVGVACSVCLNVHEHTHLPLFYSKQLHLACPKEVVSVRFQLTTGAVHLQ